jgi:hypothetical protein
MYAWEMTSNAWSLSILTDAKYCWVALKNDLFGSHLAVWWTFASSRFFAFEDINKIKCWIVQLSSHQAFPRPPPPQYLSMDIVWRPWWACFTMIMTTILLLDSLVCYFLASVNKLKTYHNKVQYILCPKTGFFSTYIVPKISKSISQLLLQSRVWLSLPIRYPQVLDSIWFLFLFLIIF